MKLEPQPQVNFNQPISFNFMQSNQKTTLQNIKPRNSDTSNVFGNNE